MRAHRLVSLAFVIAAAGSAAIAHRLAPAPAVSPSARPPRRIFANSPALIELLFAIGAGHEVVGRSHFCSYPPEARALPDTGGFLDPNLAAIEALRADRFLVQGNPTTNAALASFAAEHRIPLEWFKIETIEDALAATVRLGEVTGHSRQAQAEVERLSAALGAARAQTPRPRPRVLVSFGRTAGELREVTTAGKNTFVIECVEAAGGDSVFGDFPQGYRSISKEAILERRPEVVLELRTEPAPDEVAAALVRDWEVALPELPAVKNHRIHVVAHEAMLTPGPRLDLVVETLAHALRGAP